MGLFILPFDHRSSFFKLFGGDQFLDDDVALARSYKTVIFSGFKKFVESRNLKGFGILVDEWLGKDIFLAAKSNEFVSCVSFEKSGVDGFEFEYDDWKGKLEELKPSFAKVLFRYSGEVSKDDLKKLKEFSDFLKGFDSSDFLLEIVIDSKSKLSESTVCKKLVECIESLTSSGINPKVWKLPGFKSNKDMKLVSELCNKKTPDSSIIILGGGDSKRSVLQILETASTFHNIIGFAVGRTIFEKPIKELHKGNLTDEEASNLISENFGYFVCAWEKFGEEE